MLSSVAINSEAFKQNIKKPAEWRVFYRRAGLSADARDGVDSQQAIYRQAVRSLELTNC